MVPNSPCWRKILPCAAFHRARRIFFQGDPGQALYLIEAGRVRIYVQDDGGQEISVNFLGAGDIFGELALIDGLPRSASAIAADETIVHVLSRERLRAHLLASPQLAYNFMQALAVRLRYSTLQVGNLTLHDVPGRLARKLLERFFVSRDAGPRRPDTQTAP